MIAPYIGSLLSRSGPSSLPLRIPFPFPPLPIPNSPTPLPFPSPSRSASNPRGLASLGLAGYRRLQRQRRFPARRPSRYRALGVVGVAAPRAHARYARSQRSLRSLPTRYRAASGIVGGRPNPRNLRPPFASRTDFMRHAPTGARFARARAPTSHKVLFCCIPPPQGRNVRSSGRRLRGFGRHASRRPPGSAPGAQKHAKTSEKQPFPSKILGKNLFLARFWLHRARTTLTRGAPRAVSFCTAWRGPGGRRRCFPSRGAAHEKRAPSNVKGRAGTRRSTGTPNPRAR